VILLAFLAGLAVGFTLLIGYYVRVDRRFKLLERRLKIESLEAFSLFKQNQKLTSESPTSTIDDTLTQNLRQILEAAPIGFLLVDAENHLLWLNLKACEFLEIGQFEITSPRLLLEVVRSYELDQLIEQTRAANEFYCAEWVFNPVSPDQKRLSRLKSRPIRGCGVPLAKGVIAVFLEDRQETALLTQQRDRWTSDVAHELKTPLTSIRLVAETLRPRVEPPLRNWVDRLLQEAIRLSNLVQDLLDFSQLEMNSQNRLNRTSVDLPKLVQSVWGSLEPLARYKELMIVYEGAESLVVQVDETQFRRVILNLLDNSIKYSPPEGLIHVAIHAQGEEDGDEMVHLEVIDQGEGFLESDLPYIFERFYRADPARTRESIGQPGSADDSPHWFTGGSGLGLAIVRQIVENHGGQVTAKNHPELGGAWLEVAFPAKPQNDPLS